MHYTEDNTQQSVDSQKTDSRYKKFIKEQQEFSKLKKSEVKGDVLHKVEHPEILDL